MNKKGLFDALNGLSQNLMTTLAEVEVTKKQVQSPLEENTALYFKNDRVRMRLAQPEQDTPTESSKQGK